MINHALIANIDIKTLSLPPEYQEWLREWLQIQDEHIENGDTSSSICFSAIISELLLFREIQRDWEGIFLSHLTDVSGKPLAYSEYFGMRLYKFAGQWQQTPIHAIYTRYWLDALLGIISETIDNYADLIEEYIQPNGWIYNPQVSVTQIRTRMKSELYMSMAQGVEILNFAERIENHRESFIATLADAPITGYISAEYFRSLALEMLGAVSQMPVGLVKTIKDCKAGEGYCDFAVKNKVDDYMGTAKRTSRDFALHSPLSSTQVQSLSKYVSDTEQKDIHTVIQQFGQHLTKEPFDIPAFTIRDIPIPFGTDISPIEIVCAAWIRQPNN